MTYITESPFIGSVRAVTESLAKLTAAGCDINNAYLSLQEYFERLRNSPERWASRCRRCLAPLPRR